MVVPPFSARRVFGANVRCRRFRTIFAAVMTIRPRFFLTLITACGLLAVSPAAQTPPTRSLYDRYTEPIPIFKTGLGTFTRPMSSTNKEAQAFFDQGFQMMYSFAKPEAVRSFREAWKRDADCAICYWGEAWAWGSYLNAPMTRRGVAARVCRGAEGAVAEGPRHAEGARAHRRDGGALRREVRRRRSGSSRIAPTPRRCRRSSAQYPDDLEIATLYADALFLLEPRRGTRDVNDPERAAAAPGAREHPGAETSTIPAPATSTCTPPSRRSCRAAPRRAPSSSAGRFPAPATSTTCRRTPGTRSGRWGDSVRANLEAWHSDQKAAIGEGFAIYPEHNLHMLLYAASYDGQGAIAMRAGKDYAKLTGDIVLPGADADPVRPLRRGARGDEPAEARDPGRALGLRAGLRASASRATPTSPQLYLGARQEGRRDVEGGVPRPHGEGPARRSSAGILEGEIQRTAGDLHRRDRVVRARRRARGRARSTTSRSRCRSRARHWLGAALLEAKRFDDAEKVYRDELKDHPHNGWSLLGLQQALEGKGKPSPRSTPISRRAGRASDTWIRSSRF